MFKEAEQHWSIQRKAQALCHEKENIEQVELWRKKWNETNHKVSNAARVENYNTNTIIPHSSGRMNVECPECKALHLIEEKVARTKWFPIFSTCCAKEKIQLPAIVALLLLLHMLLTEETVQACDFKKKICIYNATLVFTSMGAKINEYVTGTQRIYSFRI